MNALENAAWNIHQFLTDSGIPYAIIGGMAVQFWGEPCFTQDIEGIVYRQTDKLDTNYIRRWLNDFAQVLDRPEILEFFDKPWDKVHQGEA